MRAEVRVAIDESGFPQARCGTDSAEVAQNRVRRVVPGKRFHLVVRFRDDDAIASNSGYTNGVARQYVQRFADDVSDNVDAE